MEVWKSLEEFPDYEISSLGRVKSKKWGKERILIPNLNTSGYCQVCLHNKNTAKVFRIHRLVALAFLENDDGTKVIDHIDGNRNNNCVNNLRWVSVTENALNKKTNVDEPYIYPRYLVKPPNKNRRLFKTLAEAIAYRDS